MTNTLFDLYFSGKTTGTDEFSQIRLKVGKIFSVDEKTLDLLFSGKPIRIKAGVDQETAIKYRVALREAGALLDIKPHQTTTSATNLANADTLTEQFTLLPPKTGDLSDCARSVTPFTLPDISDIALAPEGTNIDESKPAPPHLIDTSGLTLGAPNTGSLEDCWPDVEPKPIPDISHIKLADQEPTKPIRDESDY